MTAGGVALLQADQGFEKVSTRYLPPSSDWIQNPLDLPLKRSARGRKGIGLKGRSGSRVERDGGLKCRQELSPGLSGTALAASRAKPWVLVAPNLAA
jgi:hypothetical protein